MYINEQYVPETPTETLSECGATIHLYNNDTSGSLMAIAYVGKSKRRAWHYRFRSLERRADYIAKWLEDRRVANEARAAARAERKAEAKAPHPLKAGDVITNTWGYDQTNVDFYVVVKATARFVFLTPILTELTETGGMQGSLLPVQPITPISDSEVTQHGVQMYRQGASVNFKHGGGCLWNGNPAWCSWYA